MHLLIDAETCEVVVPRLVIAPAVGLAAMRGLLGRSGLSAEEGLLLSDPLRCVHTIGMRFPIDVVFLDRAFRVAAVTEAVPPGRIAWCRRGRHQLELAAGRARALGLHPGRALCAVPIGTRGQGGRGRAGSPRRGDESGDAAHEAARRSCADLLRLPSIPPAAAFAGGAWPIPKGAERCARTC